MNLPEVGTTLTDSGGRIFLVFEPGRMVRIDEPFDIRNFDPKQLPIGFEIILLPAETRRIIFDLYKAIPDTEKNK